MRAGKATPNPRFNQLWNRYEIGLPGPERDLDAATAKRNALLLSGSDKALAEAEAGIIAAHATLDRVSAIKSELEPRLAAAEKAEAEAALMAERDAVDTEAQEVAAKLRARWLALQAEMIAMLRRLEECDRAVLSVNEKLGAAGRGDERIDQPEWRARPRPEFEWEGVASLAANVVLPAVAEWKAPGWRWCHTAAGDFRRGRGRDAAENRSVREQNREGQGENHVS